MTNQIERYEWCDALIKAESLGLLEPGAVDMCQRLASAITWKPKGKPSGLYWKNEDALKSVGSSRATYYRYRESLFETGFFILVAGNLLPQLPDLSQIETTKSHIETDESQIETEKSQNEHPYTVDTYTVDVFSEDSFIVKEPVVADAPTSLPNLEIKDEPTNSPNVGSADNLPNLEVGELRESQSETTDSPAPEGVLSETLFKRAWHTMDTTERDYFKNYTQTPEQLQEAVRLYRSGSVKGTGWMSRADDALEQAGVSKELLAAW